MQQLRVAEEVFCDNFLGILIQSISPYSTQQSKANGHYQMSTMDEVIQAYIDDELEGRVAA